MFKRNNIIVFGSINTDISIKGQRLPKPGETLYAETISYSGGGKGANQAIAASRLNNHDSRIEMIGSIGDDIFSKNNLEKLKTEGISVQGIRTIPNTSNGTAVIFLDEESENYILIVEGANYKCNQTEIDYLSKIINNKSILLLQHEIPIKIIHQSMKIGYDKKALIILNPAPYMKIGIKDYYRNVSILTPNKIEAENISNIMINSIEDAYEAGKKIRSLGPLFVIITLGEKGCVLISDQGKVHIDTPKVNVVNSVGAGDCFNGALAIGIKNGLSIIESIKFANKSASISVSKGGVQESMPYFKEIINH
ncbi:MAG: ribokinase [Chloroflexi bacterium]|nr:ribokinase [Chloroflexota bacterium]|tara:strand:+ start:1137 stop:2063 length:927 start_codon:yes stop_codon:yes gene_type:complete